MNTLRPCERTSFEKAPKTITKKIVKSLSFSGSCKERDSVFLSKDDREFYFLFEGGVRGVRKPQNRTDIRQKTANRIGFFPNTEIARTWRPQYES